MFNDVNVLEEIPGENPTSYGRNLFDHMFDGRSDLIVTDNGRQPASSNRRPISKDAAKFIKSKLFLEFCGPIYVYKIITTIVIFEGCVKKKFGIPNSRFLRVWPQVRNSINAKGRYRNYAARQIIVERDRAEARDREEYERN